MKAKSIYHDRPSLSRLPRLLWRLVCVGFKIETEFRTDFWMALLNFVVWNALFVAFWQSIVGRGQSLGSWTTGELLLLTLIMNLHGTLSIPFLGFQWLPERVREGALDKYLCRPVSPILMTCFESIHTTVFVRSLIIELAAIGGCIWYFRLPVTLWRAALAALLLIVAVLIWACIQGTAALLSFWMGQVQTVTFFVNVGRRFERYPIDLFPQLVRVSLTWFMPAAFTAAYPTMVLLDKPLNLTWVFTVALALLSIWSAILAFVSSRALARYEAFGG